LKGVAPRPRLFIDAQHGLCNRLRAISSAASIAGGLGYELVVIWVPDHHCACRLQDLIIYPGPVIEEARAAALARQHAARVYNYMEIEPGAVLDAPILPEIAPQITSKSRPHNRPTPPPGDVYIRSAYTLVGPHVQLAGEQAFLRRLVPAPAVRALVESVPHPNDVAVHVRMSTGPGFDHLSWESPENWPAERHREMIAWREKSAVQNFAARLDVLVAEGRAERVFLAADLPETYAFFTERYGTRVVALERGLYDRSAAQLQYGLADLILLTAADRFLASTWSSFSDIAQRLARPGRAVEQSGIDF
jgi:hypothetical protein